MHKIKWGIIGPGSIAHKFAHDFQFVKNGQLHAVASRSMDRALSFAEKYNIPRAYNNYEQLYNDPEIDAVYVATPHNFHAQNSLDALQAGKGVLCEKPLTPSYADSKNLIDTARSRGVYLLEGMWSYFLPVIKKAKFWVDNGRIGKILHIKSEFGYPVPFDAHSRAYNPDLAGGTLLDMGIYPIAMAWYFLQEDPKHIHVIAKKAITGVDKDVNMIFEYESATANLHSSFNCKLHNWTYIFGKNGYIAIPDFWQARECFLYDGKQIIDTYKDDRQGFGFNFEIESVNDDLLAGKTESKTVPFDWSLKLQSHMHRVMQKF